MRKKSKKGRSICIWITDSLCFTAKTNNIVKLYIPKKFKSKKKKNFQFVFADKVFSVLFALLFDLKISLISFFQGIITR